MINVDYQYVCPKCGKPTTYNQERNGLCIDCFLETKRSKIEEKIKVKITICLGCRRLKHGKEWLEPTKENIEIVLRSGLKRTSLRMYDYTILDIPEGVKEDLREVKKIFLPVQVFVANRKVVVRHIEVDIDKAFCTLCGQKQSGKYYEAVIHVRYMRGIIDYLSRSIDLFLEEISRKLDRLEIIDVKKEGKRGLVIRFSDRKLARRFLEYLSRNYSIAILRKYKEPITVISEKDTRRQVVIEKYFIRIIHEHI